MRSTAIGRFFGAADGPESRVSAVGGIIPAMRTRRCPECGSDQVGRVLYGMPSPDQLEDARYYLAGCVVIVGEERRYGCRDCDAMFDKPAVASPAAAR